MRLIEGANGLAVGELTRGALHVLAEKAWKGERVALLASLDESGADPELRLKTLRENDLSRGTIGPLAMESYRILGCDAIIAAACEAARVNPAEFVAGLDDRERQRIAREVMGFRPVGETTGGTPTSPPDR